MKLKGFSPKVLVVLLVILGVGLIVVKSTDNSNNIIQPLETSGNRLFIDVDPGINLNKKEGPWIVRQRAADVQWHLLKNKNIERITLNLFHDVNYEVEITDSTITKGGGFSWLGNVTKFNSVVVNESVQATIFVNRDTIALSVAAAPGVNKYIYRTQPIGGAPYYLKDRDHYLIYEIDSSKFSPD